MSITRASMFFIVSFVLAAAAPAAVADEVQPNPPTGISPSAVPLQGDPPDPLGLPLDESEDQKIRKELQRRGNPDPLPPDMIGPDREPFRILPDVDDGAPSTQPVEDPDTSTEIKSAWVAWHKNLDNAIADRFSKIATKHYDKGSLTCQISYTISRAGRVTNLRLLEKSPNLLFNSSGLLVLHSMQGSPQLAFPNGSRRTVVNKVTTFFNSKTAERPSLEDGSKNQARPKTPGD